MTKSNTFQRTRYGSEVVVQKLKAETRPSLRQFQHYRQLPKVLVVGIGEGDDDERVCGKLTEEPRQNIDWALRVWSLMVVGRRHSAVM